MKHLALYRKWRPQRFDEVVGQEHISRTLLNAIKHDRLSHAYLFCGPRGTGKTTSARLLAKTLNCSDRQDGEPCNQCQNCQEITAGHSLDVVEIDAASNRGIDSARELREQVRFSSTSGQYRVFIIDEFHMLTKEAFNALLKTLEEPPENVIFVLATTEPHEVLATIVSRCQRFDFQRIATRALAEHLQKVAKAEQILVSNAAIDAMSRKANGGLRDGLSLLDQVQALADPGEALPDNLVYQSLGLVQEDEILAILNSAFTGQLESMLKTLRSLLEDGHDALQIVQELIQLLRHLSLSCLPAEQLENLGVPSHLLDSVRDMGSRISRGMIVSAIDLLLKTADRLHHCPQPDIWLEADLICLCLQAEKSLLHRIESLEQQITQSLAAPQQTLAAQPRVAPPAPKTMTSAKPAPESRPEPKPELYPAAPLTHAPVDLPEVISITDSPVVPGSVDGDMQTLWRAFLGRVREEQPMMYGFLSNGKLVNISSEAKVWVIEFSQGGKALLNRLQQRLKGGDLQALVSEVMNAPYGIETRLESAKKKTNPVASEPVSAPQSSDHAVPELEIQDSPPLPSPILHKPEPPASQPILPDPLRDDEPDLVDDCEDHMVDMEYLPEQNSETAPEQPIVPTDPVDEAFVPHLSESASIDALQEPASVDAPVQNSDKNEWIQEIAEMFKGKVLDLD